MSIENLAVITTGGDAPGMNAVIRAIVRTTIYRKHKIFGIERGWRGLAEGRIEELELKSVGGIINRGGTILQTSRTPEFQQKKFRAKAVGELQKRGIDGLIVIGGNGSMRSAATIARECGIKVNLVPASIDNDVPGTDETIGFDTAVNTAVEAIDKIRDTATSHQQLFVVQVMGRDNGFVAVRVGLACGAESILIPEVKYNVRHICDNLQRGQQRGKKSSIIVMAEGAGDIIDFARIIGRHSGMDVRISILGHMQRGGSPTAQSRFLAAKLGNAAVESILAGRHGIVVGWKRGSIAFTPFTRAMKEKRSIDVSSMHLAEILAK